MQPSSSNAPAAAQPRILVVDDDPAMRKLIADSLEEHGFRISSAANGSEMAQAMAQYTVDLVVLDLRLQGEDGMELARKLRQDSQIPIVMVTGRAEEVDRVMGLEIGADDYVLKPFSSRELVARIRAVLRRYQAARALLPKRDDTRRAWRFSGWELNLRSRRLTDPEGKRVELTNGEFNLLLAFCSAPFQILGREQLLDLSRLHGADEVYDRSVDVSILRLRRKIEPDPARPQFIKTERGAGYVFNVPVEVLY
ncbi:MAG TPA: response regulator [Caldimonas sp.]|nr:response regulator [Caldimonas sp.]